MVGILYYFIFIFSGIIAAMMLFDDFKRHEKIVLGLAMGVVLGAWLPAGFSLLLSKFGVLSHVLALVFLIIGIAALWFFKGKAINPSIQNYDKKDEIVLLCLVVPFAILIGILFSGHVLVMKDGSFYGGQSTYGDTAMHLGMITSIANQGQFPPDYSIMPGQRLSYPFLVNSQSATLYLMGTSLKLSVIIPSMVMSIVCFAGFYVFARRIAKKKGAAVLAFLLFFITGGLGFFYFLDNPQTFKEIFTGFYLTPTNHIEFNLRWVNVICDMMVPQRTTLMGWSVLIPTMMLLWNGLKSGKKLNIAIAGIMAGSLPMIHTHSFLALGILCFGWLLMGTFDENISIKDWIIRWIIFVIPVGILAAPQLFFWIFTQSKGFVQVHLDWVNVNEPSIWFWVKNIGLPILFIIPALIWGHKKYGAWYIGAIIIFMVGLTFSFQPNFYDNNKLLLVWYMLTCVLVADYMIFIWEKLKSVPGRDILAVFVGITLFASGILSIMRELNSNGEYQLFNSSHVRAAQCIEEKTPTDALFITGRQHLNAPAALAGRNVYVGSGVYLHFHGLGYQKREQEVNTMYTNIAASKELMQEIGVDYAYLSSYERYHFGVESSFFSDYPLVYDSGEVMIFAISEQAKALGTLCKE